MIRIQGDGLFVTCRHRYGKLLPAAVRQIHLLSDAQLLGAGQLCDLDPEYRARIVNAICLLRHQMHIDYLADLHIRNCRIKSPDHHPGAAHKLQRLTTVVRRVELSSVIEGPAVMHLQLFTDILPLDSGHTAAAAASGAAAFFFPVTAVMVLTMMTTAVLPGMVGAVVILSMMMITGHAGILQFAPQIGLHGRIRIALCTCAHFDSRIGKSILRTAADAAADQHIHAVTFEHARKRSVALPVRIYYLGGNDLLILYLIQLKKLCLSKMLKYFAVVVGHCNFHLCFISLFNILLILGLNDPVMTLPAQK